MMQNIVHILAIPATISSGYNFRTVSALLAQIRKFFRLPVPSLIFFFCHRQLLLGLKAAHNPSLVIQILRPMYLTPCSALGYNLINSMFFCSLTIRSINREQKNS